MAPDMNALTNGLRGAYREARLHLIQSFTTLIIRVAVGAPPAGSGFHMLDLTFLQEN